MKTPMKTLSLLNTGKSRLFVAAASAFVILGALGPTRAEIQDGAGVLRSASDIGAAIEQVQFRFGGYDYCWYDDGWRGPGWYWCGYAYRTGYGWGGPLGWNNWRRVFRDRDDFRGPREFRDRDHDRDFHDRDFHFRDRDFRDRDWRR